MGLKTSAGLKTLAMSVAIFALSRGAGQAAEIQFAAALTGGGEVPANATAGTGMATATLDTATKVFHYVVTYSGLTGPAVAAHFHGPALAGNNAPPVITIKSLPSPMNGEATLTDPQIADLEAGRWYFNVHTADHPTGEIRGQLAKTP